MTRDLLRLTLLILACLSITVSAVPVDLWFGKANTFYEQQAYDSAAVYYERIVASGVNNSDLFYNLGNTYFRLNKLGLSILYYEKALKLDPNDPDILANSRFAPMNIVDRVPEPQRTFFAQLLWRFHTLIPLNAQLWILFCCLMFISISFALGLFASHNIRLWLIYSGSIVSIVAIGLGVSAGVKIYDAENRQYAIVLEKTVDARNQPQGDKILFSVHEGIKFQIRKTDGTWCFVSLPNGVSGWVESSALGKI